MSPQATKFYVATNRDDKWSGLLDAPNADGCDGPFATLTRVLDAVRQLKLAHGGGLIQSVLIQVRSGKSHLDQPLRLCGRDSGSARFPVTYMAYPGEQPTLSGGKPITGWQPYKGKIVCVHLPETRKGLWWFRQLFDNHNYDLQPDSPAVKLGFQVIETGRIGLLKARCER